MLCQFMKKLLLKLSALRCIQKFAKCLLHHSCLYILIPHQIQKHPFQLFLQSFLIQFIFQKIIKYSQINCLFGIIKIRICSQKQNPCLRKQCSYLLNKLQPIHNRHTNICYNKIRSYLSDSPQCCNPVRKGLSNSKSVFSPVCQCFQILKHQQVIIHQNHLKCHVSSSIQPNLCRPVTEIDNSYIHILPCGEFCVIYEILSGILPLL